MPQQPSRYPDYCVFYTLISACGNCCLAKAAGAAYIMSNNNKKERADE
ncbi:MAG: Uncharacterised protein [Alphaproteobacteria bacterium]|nr:MAG: Uncharacterised protein [Alphaproteobacteria bacterium]